MLPRDPHAPERTGLRPETIAVTAGRPESNGAPVNVPISTTSTYIAPDSSGLHRMYARGDSTDTVVAFEEAVGALEQGTAVAFSSGMAAISAVLDQFGVGAKIVAPTDCYQGTASVLEIGERDRNWSVTRLGVTDTAGIVDAMDGADLLWLESPTNPLLETADLPELLVSAMEKGVQSAVDNTFATPLLQQPLELGATYSVHSATKFIGGHSDLLAGIALSRDAGAVDRLVERRNFGGAVLGSLEAFLALRGLRTLPLRMERSQHNARMLSGVLSDHAAVTNVRYPGWGALVSFETVGAAAEADAVIAALRVITGATSLGGVESLIERRNRLTGQEHIPPSLLRLSVGCEHIDDLSHDLEQALDSIAS